MNMWYSHNGDPVSTRRAEAVPGKLTDKWLMTKKARRNGTELELLAFL